MTDKPDWAQIIASQLWCLPQHSSKEMDCDFVESISAALRNERERCNMIVQAARNGDIDTDFRSISQRITSGSRMSYENGEYKDED
jgi:hypothetical protein